MPASLLYGFLNTLLDRHGRFRNEPGAFNQTGRRVFRFGEESDGLWRALSSNLWFIGSVLVQMREGFGC